MRDLAELRDRYNGLWKGSRRKSVEGCVARNRQAKHATSGSGCGLCLRRGIAASHLALAGRDRAADLDAGFAKEAVNDLVPVVVFDQLVFAALWIGTLDGEDHGSITDCGLRIVEQSHSSPVPFSIHNLQFAIRNFY